jgi:hypothetical protein
LKMKFPVIPDVWDEMLIYGGIAAGIGVSGAYYVEELVTISIVGCSALAVAIGYTLWRRHRKNKMIRVQGAAVLDLVETVEVFKGNANASWETVKNKIKQLPATEDIVAALKPEIKKRLQGAENAVS